MRQIATTESVDQVPHVSNGVGITLKFGGNYVVVDSIYA